MIVIENRLSRRQGHEECKREATIAYGLFVVWTSMNTEMQLRILYEERISYAAD
jgi:hypothetical protein